MRISVCVGSSCHLKGSYDVILGFQKLISEYDVGDKVDLEASFCLGHCAEGVTIKIDDEIITGLTGQNVRKVFEERVPPGVEK